MAKSTATKRGQGRPSDGGVGRAGVMKAARKLLQELPPARVTISLVAREAGIDPALVRYYFGDRSNLLLEVVNEMLHGLPVPADPSLDGAEALRNEIKHSLRFTHSAKHMQRLMIDELAESKSAEVRERHRELNLRAIELYRDLMARKGGTELRQVDPMFLYLTVVGIFDFFVSAEPMVKSLVPEDADMEALSEQFTEFVTDLLLNGLRK